MVGGANRVRLIEKPRNSRPTGPKSASKWRKCAQIAGICTHRANQAGDIERLSEVSNMLRYCAADAVGAAEKCTIANFKATTTANYFVEVSAGFRGGVYNVKVLTK